MGRILEPLEAQVLLKCASARKAAVEGAAKEIQKDVKLKVFDQAVEDYYSDYKPKRYKRKQKPGGLYRAFKVHEHNDGRRIEISGEWNHNWLPQYKSGSKKGSRYHQRGNEWISRYDDDFDWNSNANGMPEKGWIFQNYMEGIHPKFYVDKELDIVVDESERFEPSYLRIKEYKDEYFAGDDMKNILLKHLKKQYKKM